MASAVYRSDGTLVGHVERLANGYGSVTSVLGDRTGQVGSGTGTVLLGGQDGTPIGGVTEDGLIYRGGSQDGYGWSGGDYVGRVYDSGEVMSVNGASAGHISPPIPAVDRFIMPDTNSHLRIMGGAALVLLF